MNNTDSNTKPLRLFMALMLAATLASCGGGDGGKDPILGGSGITANAPTVTATAPAPGATGVPLNTAVVTAAFSRPMDPATLTATSFLLACPAATPVTGGVVSYQATGNLATLTLPALFDFPASTECTATVTSAAKDPAGVALASNFVWTFNTGALADAIRPRVTITVPATTTPAITGVVTNTAITAAFTEDMAPATIDGTSFTVTCAAPCVSPVGTVSYVVGSRTAVFTHAAALTASTTYTATVTTAATDLAGNTLAGNQAALPAASNYVWTFTTSAAADTTRPRVTTTVPLTTTPGPTLGFATNAAITATFTEDMAPATISTASFTVTCAAPCVSPVGTTSYVVGSRTASFNHVAALANSATYTATVTTAATDLAGNTLAGNQAALPAASNYVWTFTTAAAADVVPPTITLEAPLDLATNVALNAAINATFSEAMATLSISTATFTVQPSGPPLGIDLLGAVTYNALTHVATFTPDSNLLPSTSYTVTVSNLATDLAGNALVAGLLNNPWTFTTGTGLAPGAANLGSAKTFGIMATSAITSTGNSVINGDVSLDPGTSMTGFPPAIVNGAIHINDTVSAQARADLLVAYNFAKGLPPGTTISAGQDLGALNPGGVLAPGTYTSGSTMLVSTPLVLDAGGDANAVWTFQIGSSLTTSASVSLTGGAQEKNVFWVPTQDATIGVGTIFNGNIITGRDANCITGAVIHGRILAGAITAGTIALQGCTVNVPATP